VRIHPVGERTGWRDAEISARHRRWGVACHACDIDFLLVEHCFGLPVALVEYKALGAREEFGGVNYRALGTLAARAELPFIVAVYDPVNWGVRVYPMNEHAQSDFSWGQDCTERDWVGWLHRLRSRAVDSLTSIGLSDELPRSPLDEAV
jgi:hypothetical protein